MPLTLARYNVLAGVLAGDTELFGTAAPLLYRFDRGAWTGLGGVAVPAPTAAVMTEALRSGLATSSGRLRESFIAVPELDAVVRVDAAALRRIGSEALRRRVATAAHAAAQHFKATHHDLTGLINRAECNRVLLDRLAGMSEVGAGRAVGVVALDIDHFKQINDTFGHHYGDTVLRALATRIERVLLDRAPATGCDLIPAHPSGEEFLIVVSGPFVTAGQRAIAEAIRQGIAAQPLPTAAEWAALDRGGDAEDLPEQSLRHVTVSLGFSHRVGPVAKEAVAELGFALKREADIALYRAKATGRNRSVAFEEVIQRYGRVLEHHADTDIVAIDLGRQVAVSVGQGIPGLSPDLRRRAAFHRRRRPDPAQARRLPAGVLRPDRGVRRPE